MSSLTSSSQKTFLKFVPTTFAGNLKEATQASNDQFSSPLAPTLSKPPFASSTQILTGKLASYKNLDHRNNTDLYHLKQGSGQTYLSKTASSSQDRGQVTSTSIAVSSFNSTQLIGKPPRYSQGDQSSVVIAGKESEKMKRQMKMLMKLQEPVRSSKMRMASQNL